MVNSTVMLSLIAYVTTAELITMVLPVPLPMEPVTLLEPLRIANQYGLFAVMTRGRYEIEFQGSRDGRIGSLILSALNRRPWIRLRAFTRPTSPVLNGTCGLPRWGRGSRITWSPQTEERLLKNDPDVLALFAGNPFAGEPSPPGEGRAVAVLVYVYTAEAADAAPGGRGSCWGCTPRFLAGMPRARQ